jgi:hypothetical protein
MFDFPDDADELHRRRAYDLHGFWGDNDQLLMPVRRGFRLAAAANIAGNSA